MPVIDDIRPVTVAKPKTERPPLYKVVLLNDDYTPFELVMTVLVEVFGLGNPEALAVMLEAHQKGSCVVASYQKDVADTKAREGEDLAKGHGHALKFPVERD